MAWLETMQEVYLREDNCILVPSNVIYSMPFLVGMLLIRISLSWEHTSMQIPKYGTRI